MKKVSELIDIDRKEKKYTNFRDTEAIRSMLIK